ncbi:hypothetical protein HN51_005903 [Arachis hypogaea]|uniref:uncharacterized protein n=1 Tax=Arachis hypogaea TaxID=3818 RepID=UPI000DED1D45|nr:uncharacterized protein LOC112797520 [Arachis hypogaea]
MSTESEDKILLDHATDHGLQKKGKITYTREFMLSLSGLDVCRELPSGFDRSLLSEFEDAPQERQRSTGGLSMHSFRRNEYSSSPPTRSDSFSRGVHGKWESRSSGRSDKDSDSQSEWDSDSGKRFGNQSRRSWQSPEHDGLLGSGSFPRPTGYSPGLSASKFRANDSHQLNRSNEPYHPPRPYKAPHSRRETNDSYNDETFGSLECTSEDRVEEERKRRASFELMRKEQQKSFQEKNKLNPGKSKDEFDINSLLDDDEKKLINRNDESVEPAANLSALSNDEKSSVSHAPSAARPLVPPGFVPPGFGGAMLERNSVTKTSSNICATEVGPSEPGDTNGSHAFNMNSENIEEALSVKEADLSAVDTPGIKLGMGDQVRKRSALSEALESSEDSEFIVGGEKGGLQMPNMTATQHTTPNFPSQNLEPVGEHLASSVAHANISNSEQFYKSEKTEVVPAVLTCEDLEQSILSQVGENGSSSKQPMQDKDFDVKTEPSTPNIDNHASHHLLSLLQKGTSHKDVELSSILDSNDKVLNPEVATAGNVIDNPLEANADVSSSSKTLTLETLFGTAFMKELQSVGAPVSVQRGSVGSAGGDVSDSMLFPFPTSDTIHTSSGEHLARHGSGVTSEKSHQPKSSRLEEQWLGYGDSQRDLNPLLLENETSNISGFNRRRDFHLPEEDSLLSVGDPLRNFLSAGNSVKTDLSQDTSIDITRKLAALNPGFRDERLVRNQEGLPYPPGPYDMREPGLPYNLNVQRAPQLHPPQMNHMGPMFNQMDSHRPHISSYMKLGTPEGMVRHDSPPNHQFPGNMLGPPFHQPNPGFDHAQHSMLQQMQMQGNLPPPHLLRGFPRGGPMPPHASNPMTGFMQEPNPMQGIPFSGHQHPNFGPGMQVQAPEVGGGRNHPEALQRLFEMELRANSKPIHASGHSQGGMYGQELDLGFGYR